MSEEILVNFTPMESRVAVIENGVAQEIYIERTASKGLVGNIYMGKVVRVLPGMQAAFVDIGLEKAAFIHASDFVQAKNSGKGHSSIDPDSTDSETDSQAKEKRTKEKESNSTANIKDLVVEGQFIVVQVVKDMIGTKGARLTTELSIPSRFMVLMPFSSHIGISQRIDDEAERERLRSIIESQWQEMQSPQMGVIARTAAEGVEEDAIRQDCEFLLKLWRKLDADIKSKQKVASLHEDLPLYLRTVRDLLRPDVDKVRIDSRETYGKVLEFVTQFMPGNENRIEHYPGERPIFDLYGVEDEIQKALGRKVELKSGGYIIVEQTEAMATIDVNTGAFVGHRNLEETIYKTNLEAAHAIARQLRLRNIGGIVILDFIDMEEEEHRRQVLRTLEKMLDRDHAKTKITQVSELGLIEMTRKRTRESLPQMLCEPCSVCDGKGQIKTAETVCFEIFRELLREHRAFETDSYLVIASQTVVDRLLDEESANVADLELFIGKTIKFQVEALYTQEQFDVVLL